MRTVIHISDIHFGRVDRAIVEPLVLFVKETAPDVVVISGDLTQRARESQFVEARDFLARLPVPQIIVPGNHDVPLYNLMGRFLRPLVNYRRFISEDLEPYYADCEIAVAGISTARSLTFKSGRISYGQMDRIRQRFCCLGENVIKMVVTHHPLDVPGDLRRGTPVGRARLAMKALTSCGVDLLLAGHYHVSRTGGTTYRYPMPGYSALVVHAGTATSTRGRGELNSFNVIRTERPYVMIDRLEWRADRRDFEVSVQERYERRAEGWIEVQK